MIPPVAEPGPADDECARPDTTQQITCILAYRGDSDFVVRAVDYFLAQRTPAGELLVVSDRAHACGAQRLVDQLAGRSVRLHVTDGTVPHAPDIGELRAWASRLPGVSDIAVWWSAVDWSAPWRLSGQLEEMERSGADAVLATDVAVYHLRSGRASTRPGPAPASLMLRVAAPTGRAPVVLHVADPTWFARVESDGPTGGAPGRRLADVADRMGEDLTAFGSWRAGGPLRVPPRPAPLATGPRPLDVVAPMMVFDGLGSMGEYLVRSLARTGLAVSATPLEHHRPGLSSECLDLVDRAAPHPGDPTLLLAWAGTPAELFARPGPLVVTTAWESTRLPEGFAERLNLARAVVAPSTWVRDVLRGCGVAVPVEVVAQGADPTRYFPVSRPAALPGPLRGATGRSLTTLVVASLSPRKNLEQAVAAWKQAFADDPAARLVIKARFGWQDYQPDDPRIRFVDTTEPTPGIAHWYHRADILLALGAEGFGLPLVEAMACGLVVVALDAQGQSDAVADAPGCLLPVPAADWVPYDDGRFSCGLRAVPDVPATVAALEWVRDHPEAAARMGAAAATWARAHRDVWSMGPAMLEILHRHLGYDALAWARPHRRPHPHPQPRPLLRPSPAVA